MGHVLPPVERRPKHYYGKPKLPNRFFPDDLHIDITSIPVPSEEVTVVYMEDGEIVREAIPADTGSYALAFVIVALLCLFLATLIAIV